MKLIYPAIERRFRSDPRLRRLGRKLERGFQGEPLISTMPFVDVSGVLSDTLDTFGSDIEQWDVTFTYFSASQRPKLADDWLEAMVRVFDDANLNDAEFSTVGVKRTGRDEPFMEDGTYRASVSYDVIVQRTNKLPANRYA